MFWYKDRGERIRRKEKIRKGGKEGSNSGSYQGGGEAKTKKKKVSWGRVI